VTIFENQKCQPLSGRGRLHETESLFCVQCFSLKHFLRCFPGRAQPTIVVGSRLFLIKPFMKLKGFFVSNTFPSDIPYVVFPIVQPAIAIGILAIHFKII
jgi:hypothetical protein